MVVRIYATVKNIGDTPVWIKVRGYARKGDSYAWSDYSDTVQLNRGQSKQFVIDVPTTPQTAGTWYAGVVVYDATVAPPKKWKQVEKPFTVKKDVSITIDKIEIR